MKTVYGKKKTIAIVAACSIIMIITMSFRESSLIREMRFTPMFTDTVPQNNSIHIDIDMKDLDKALKELDEELKDIEWDKISFNSLSSSFNALSRSFISISI